jgi:hypothetical protein
MSPATELSYASGTSGRPLLGDPSAPTSTAPWRRSVIATSRRHPRVLAVCSDAPKQRVSWRHHPARIPVESRTN